jgi:uncharacterized protein YkwD
MRTRLAKILCVGVLIGLLMGAGTAVAETGTTTTNSVTTGTLHARNQMQLATNRSRVNHGVHRVSLNARLSELARRHSVAMARKGSLFHTGNPSAYYLRGVKWHVWGENVGVTGGTVPQLESAFMASTEHRANILKRTYYHSAVGAVRMNGQLWVTVFFYG